MEALLKAVKPMPKELSDQLPPKYFVHGREDGERIVLSVVLETEKEIYGFVVKTTVKGAVSKPWSMKRDQLERMLLCPGFGRKWEVSLSQIAV